MKHPWEKIDLKAYETHMSSNMVFQSQTLNNITKEQITDYNPINIAILGIAGGNGLENIKKSEVKKVYCIDINQNYLNECKKRYSHLEGILDFICYDLSKDNVILPIADIHICNLIIEYLGEEKFSKLILNSINNIKILSCVIQKNNDVDFVSQTNQTSTFDPILSIHNDIDEIRLIKSLNNINIKIRKKTSYNLPNGKEFLRIDFVKALK